MKTSFIRIFFKNDPAARMIEFEFDANSCMFGNRLIIKKIVVAIVERLKNLDHSAVDPISFELYHENRGFAEIAIFKAKLVSYKYVEDVVTQYLSHLYSKIDNKVEIKTYWIQINFANIESGKKLEFKFETDLRILEHRSTIRNMALEILKRLENLKESGATRFSFSLEVVGRKLTSLVEFSIGELNYDCILMHVKNRLGSLELDDSKINLMK